MKRILAILIIMFICGSFIFSDSNCDSETPTADKKQTAATRKLMDEAEAQVGMPAIKNFQERKLAKMIFELRDQEDLICYAYIKSDYSGKLNFIGKCIGFGLPYSIQYTSPSYHLDEPDGGDLAMPQPDPNGLFMPEGLSATWLMMVDPETGDARPVYVESEITVSPFKLSNAIY